MGKRNRQPKKGGLSVTMLVLGVLCIVSIGFTMGAYVTKTQASDSARVASFGASADTPSGVTLSIENCASPEEGKKTSDDYSFTVTLNTEVKTELKATVSFPDGGRLPAGLTGTITDGTGHVYGTIPANTGTVTIPLDTIVPTISEGGSSEWSHTYLMKYTAANKGVAGSYTPTISVEAVQVN